MKRRTLAERIEYLSGDVRRIEAEINKKIVRRDNLRMEIKRLHKEASEVQELPLSDNPDEEAVA